MSVMAGPMRLPDPLRRYPAPWHFAFVEPHAIQRALYRRGRGFNPRRQVRE